MKAREHKNIWWFNYTVQAFGSLYRTYISKVFDPISKMSFYVFVSKPSPRMTLQEWESGGSGGNFVPQLGPFASKPASTRRKGTQTNQNIKKLESLLIIVVEVHKRAALQQWHLQSSFLQVYSDQPLVRQTLEAARRILIPPQMWTLVSSQVYIIWHVASSDLVNMQP